MAVGVLTAGPEFTKQIYDDVTEKMFGHASPMREDEAPEEKLGPAVGEVMGGPPPEGGAPQYFPIEVLIIPH
jgi:hypothetical protein